MHVTELTIEDIGKIRKTFSMFDSDKVGLMKESQVGYALRWLKLIPTEKEIAVLLQTFGIRKGGFLTLEQFTTAAAQFWIKDRFEFEHELWKAFLLFDTLSTGYLTGYQLRKILTVYGLEPIPSKEVDKIMKTYGDPKLDRVEYGYLIRGWQN